MPITPDEWDGKLFQIYQDDLADLERIVPQISDKLMEHLDPALKTQFRRLKTILSDVRWNYGPPLHVEKVQGDDNDE